MIDFRSDTVTKPTKEMKEAMFNAPVGDDVFQDDPTVNALEERVARMFGKEGALFCPSGTMTNQIAIRVHTKPGDDVICHELAHIYQYEGGGIASNAGASTRLIRGNQGRFKAEDVLDSIQNSEDVHLPLSRLVAAENTCNKGGGVIWNNEDLRAIKAVCKEHNLSFHLDGARLFNALVETGESTQSVGETFDSISICMSKGLGCPIGSLLIGDADFIKQARRVRKVFGGGMRQVGFMAAAVDYALDHHVNRLKDDHRKAAYLGQEIMQAEWCESIVNPETNILVANIAQGYEQDALLNEMKTKGVLAVGFGKGRIRFVTHLDIDESNVNKAAEILKTIN